MNFALHHLGMMECLKGFYLRLKLVCKKKKRRGNDSIHPDLE